MAAKDRSLTWMVVLTAAALAVRLALVSAVGERYDIETYARWALFLGHHPPWQFSSGAGYPPGYFLVALAVGRTYAAWTATQDPNAVELRILLKLVPIACDLIAAWVIAAIAQIIFPRLRMWIAAAWLFNPVAIIDSAYWGQIDSIALLPAFLSLLLILCARNQPLRSVSFATASWVAMIVSLLVKPQAAPVMFALICGVASAPRAMLRRLAIGSVMGIAIGCVGAWLATALFSGHIEPSAAAAWEWHELTFSTGGFSYTSVNAFNLWATAMPFFIPDSFKIAGVSCSTIGLVLVCATDLALIVRFARLRTDASLVTLAALLSLSTFVLATRMHERYIDASLMLAIALAGTGRRWIFAAVALTATGTVNLMYALRFATLFDPNDPTRLLPTTLNVRDLWPAISHPLSLINVIVLIVLAARFLRDPRIGASNSTRIKVAAVT
jgi:Gpi18-like mannosyltransferase